MYTHFKWNGYAISKRATKESCELFGDMKIPVKIQFQDRFVANQAAHFTFKIS